MNNMINPRILRTAHQRVGDMSRPGVKIYLPSFRSAGFSRFGRGEFKTATQARQRAEKVKTRWVRLYDAAILFRSREVENKADHPIHEDLEHIGMGLDCAECGNPTSWLPCWNCYGEGGQDDEELMEEDPLWYGPGDYRRCDECHGQGGHPYCLECRKIVKVVEDNGVTKCKNQAES